MIVSLDRLCARYHLLPSQAIKVSDTFDLYVMDIALRYDKVQEQKKNGTYNPSEHYSENELLEILNNSKGKQND